MPREALWKELLNHETLTRGWHLARLDTKKDFAEDLYATDVYGTDLKLHLQETVNRLETETFQPRPLLRMEVPKGSLGFRPGAVIPIQDRVVVASIVLLLAPEIDKKLSDSVYSWRLKEPVPNKGPIFKETDITDLPFLKRSTIIDAIDPFEPWYAIWPEFDEESRGAFLEEEFRFLSTSDIAAYFENIQLLILRDQLLGHFPTNPRIINLLFSFLESWTMKTVDGRPHLRGIPQGNFISSFLGNLFLMPLDEQFEEFQKEHDILYYRYMDDVRIFSKRITDARRAIFTMDRELRRLHLNVQTAKTKILDERFKEITEALIDDRVDEISGLIEELDKNWGSEIPPSLIRKRYLRRLKNIARRDTHGRQKILGSRRPLEGLTLRAFLRWIYAHCCLLSDEYIGRLLYEIQLNPDYKLTKKLISTTKLFPRRRALESVLLNFIESDKNIFPHHEAECLHALRYLSRLHKRTIDHCKNRLKSQKQAPYLRMQAAYLLSRTELEGRYISQVEKLFEKERHPYVQVALSTLMVQKRQNNSTVVRHLVFHPNEKVREVGRLYRCIKTEEPIAKDRLRHMFRQEVPWLICDNMPFVHLMALSDNPNIRELLLNSIRKPRLENPIGDVKDILRRIFTRTRESLKQRQE